MNDKQKNKIINIAIPILAIFIILIIYFLLFVSLKNYSNSSISYEEKASLDRYRLDFKLEDKIISYIESKKSLNLGEMLESNFYELEVYSSYHMLENVNSDYHMLENTKSRLDLKNLLYRIKVVNGGIPREDFNYFVFYDKNHSVVKVMALNKKYDFLDGENYSSYLLKDAVFNFKGIQNSNETIYKLNNLP
ncbi:TPA: hypothetical protein KQG29_001429 [Clostridioides difficile]|nr:hypothetical protein [Clostridioides difficile]